MASNYTQIAEHNASRYGWDIERIGKMLLTDRYDDRTHFIYELLQNAEDALRRRKDTNVERSVKFDLTEKDLAFRHFGQPFTEDDVTGVCGIAESTKGLTSIGRFGIGFKSVYAFTKHPEIHSGNESFSIKSYVTPQTADAKPQTEGETLIYLPFDLDDNTAASPDIQRGLRSLGADSLLFLKEIESIEWTESGKPIGQYLREVKPLGEGVKRVDLLGKVKDQEEQFLSYLVFSDPVFTETNEQVGDVEIAFRVIDQNGKISVQAVSQSPLVAYFPTAVQTNLGFLVQGPYCTTPSRDNVPRNDAWNLKLIEMTATLLRRALLWLRDESILSTLVLECLPIDPSKFGDTSIFNSLFEKTKEILNEEFLLPCESLGYLPAPQVRIGRTREIREVLSSQQLEQLHSSDSSLDWISGDITRDKAGQLRDYLIRHLSVKEDTPQTIIRSMSESFLKAQSPEWLCNFYNFLANNKSLQNHWAELPLVRLNSGEQVKAMEGERILAYLPSDTQTSYPEVDPATITDPDSIGFLKGLGIKEPEVVDDVIDHVLPKYNAEEINIPPEEYASDFNKILSASKSDSVFQRRRLMRALSECGFVMAVDAATVEEFHVTPDEAYFSTETLSSLLAGIPGAMLIDRERYPCLRGNEARDLLTACGVADRLRPRPFRPDDDHLHQLRVQADTLRSQSPEFIDDHDLEFLDEILQKAPALPADEQKALSTAIWQNLLSLEREQRSIFKANYRGKYYGEVKVVHYKPRFIQSLRESNWVIDLSAPETLKTPGLVLLENSGLKSNPYLEKKLGFKPPILEQLAKEAGIDPKMLDLLKEVGIKSEAELRERLQLTETSEEEDEEATPGESAETSQGSVEELNQSNETRDSGTKSGGNPGQWSRNTSGSVGGSTGGNNRPSSSQPRPPQGKQFISYVGLHPDNYPNRQGMSQEERMAVEEKAIELILSVEPTLERTPPNNPGFDLFETNNEGELIKWVEVKAMSGTLNDHPVAISQTQYNWAMEKRGSYWLYIYEKVNTDDARLLKIHDPYGKSMHYTFDHGWIDIGEENND